MHQNSPYWEPKSKNFLGREHSPLPGPLPGGEGDTPSPHPTPRRLVLSHLCSCKLTLKALGWGNFGAAQLVCFTGTLMSTGWLVSWNLWVAVQVTTWRGGAYCGGRNAGGSLFVVFTVSYSLLRRVCHVFPSYSGLFFYICHFVFKFYLILAVFSCSEQNEIY